MTTKEMLIDFVRSMVWLCLGAAVIYMIASL